MIFHKLLAFGPLPIRILAGITFLAHGLPKFEDVAGTQGFFGSIGLSPELPNASEVIVNVSAFFARY